MHATKDVESMPNTIVRSCLLLHLENVAPISVCGFFLSFCQLGSRSGPEKFAEFCLPTCQAVGKHFLYQLAEFSNLHSGRVTSRAIAVQSNIVFSEVLDDPLEQ